ncbi:MAG: VOC family protein [Chloroflexota bacterium]
MLTHLNSVSVQVDDQDQAVDFYVNTLGMEKRLDVPMDEEGNRWIEVAPPGAQTTIVLSNTPGPEGPVEPGGFTGYIFSADDIEATARELEERGVELTAPLSNESWGRWAQFADPDGNEFGIWAPPVQD